LISAVAVDTDVVSYLHKGDSRADLYRSHVDGRILLVSFMTVGELERWVLVRKWGERRKQDLEDFLHRFTVINSDRELCRKWAAVTQIARVNGRPVGTADAWIAATALLYDVPLVTHNKADYAGVSGLEIISEA
jgi:tRNA(fMet)-specific endonuclease VapC